MNTFCVVCRRVRLTEFYDESFLICSFWKTVGRHMSKLDAENCKIHIIGNNVAGNTKGEKVCESSTCSESDMWCD